MAITVRFVCVRLPTGAFEVLMTSLLDAVTYPTAGSLDWGTIPAPAGGESG